MNDLMAVIVRIRAQAEGSLPPNLGQILYKSWLAWVEAREPELAQYWHAAQGLKPYACSGLIGFNPRHVEAGTEAWFRISTLEKGLTAILASYLHTPPDNLMIGDIPCELVSISADDQVHSWAGISNYEDIAAPHLLTGANPERYVKLEFASPVTFKQQETIQPMPLPDLVFGSLVDKWNAFSPIALAPEIREFCKSGLAINYFNLSSQRVEVVEGRRMVGGKGQIEYLSTRYDRYWMSIVQLLADYAFYAGVGGFTTLGLGQTRRITRLKRRTQATALETTKTP